MTFIDASDPDRCKVCGITIGRAGRTNQELAKAYEDGTLVTSFGATDYSVGPPWATTYYCHQHFKEAISVSTT
jgi:hypothetical protein